MNILCDITTISSIVQTLTILVTVPFIYWQLVEIKRTTISGAMTDAFSYLQDEEVRKGRKLLRNFKEKEKLDDWTKEEILLVEIACNAFDRVGIMVANGMIPSKIVTKNYRDSIITSWENSTPLILYNRKNRRSDYWDNFEKLYNEAKKHQ